MVCRGLYVSVCVCFCLCTPTYHIMLLQLSTKFACSGERVVFQETHSLEISQLLGENPSLLLVFLYRMNVAVTQLREFRFPPCLCRHCSPDVSKGPRWIWDISLFLWPPKAGCCNSRPVVRHAYQILLNTDVACSCDLLTTIKKQKYVCIRRFIFFT